MQETVDALKVKTGLCCICVVFDNIHLGEMSALWDTVVTVVQFAQVKLARSHACPTHHLFVYLFSLNSCIWLNGGPQAVKLLWMSMI
jgi:hypothetical protein